MELTIEGSVAVISGGAGGIGSAIARELARSGVVVHVADTQPDAVERLTAEIRQEGGNADHHIVDVSDADQVDSMFSEIDESGAQVDLLVNAAGVIEYSPFWLLEDEALLRMVNVNLIGTYLLMKEAATRMTTQGFGRIVNIASTASFVAPRLEAAAYSMTKGGVRQLTVAAAAELAPHGVLVNAIAPGTTETAFLKGSLESPEIRRKANERVPIGRVAEPSDIVGPALFLMSNLASYVSGQVLVVDGGQIARSP